MVVAALQPPRSLEMDFELRASRGVALMSHFGYSAPEDRPEHPTYDEVLPEDFDPDMEPGGGEESTDPDSEPADEPDEDGEGEAASEDGQGEDLDRQEGDEESTADTLEPIVAPDPTPVPTPTPTPAPPAPRPREPRPTPDPAPPRETRPDPTPPDPSSLPPTQRYPEGTLNPIATDVGMWGPEGAASVAIIRLDRIRRNTHRDVLESLFSGLKDYADLSAHNSINIIDDVDALLLASTDISQLQKTFIAAVHHLDPSFLMAELQRGYPSGVRWEENGGRYWGTPVATVLRRRFVIPTEQLLIFSPQEFLDDLTRGAPRPRGLPDSYSGRSDAPQPPKEIDEILIDLGLAPAPAGYDASANPCADRSGRARTRCESDEADRRAEIDRAMERYQRERESLMPHALSELGRQTREWEAARQNSARFRPDDLPPIRGDESWIGGLLQIGDLAGAGSSGPALLWSFNAISRLTIGGMERGTKRPQALHAALTLERNPILKVRLVFANRSEAEAFRGQWPNIVTHHTFYLAAAGLQAAARDATWEFDHNEAIVEIVIPRTSLARISAALRLAGAF